MDITSTFTYTHGLLLGTFCSGRLLTLESLRVGNVSPEVKLKPPQFSPDSVCVLSVRHTINICNFYMQISPTGVSNGNILCFQ